MQKDNKKDSYLNWHPNFRLAEDLPDIKVVRTGFLVNFVALTIIIIVLGMNVYRELRIRGINAEIAGFEERLSQGEASNRASIRLSSQFKKQSKIINDVQAFYAVSNPPLEFIVALTQHLPEDIALQSVNFQLVEPEAKGKKKVKFVPEAFRSSYLIRGRLQGSSAEDLNAFDRYRESLSKLEGFADKIEGIQVLGTSRNPSLDLFEFQIRLILKPDVAS